MNKPEGRKYGKRVLLILGILVSGWLLVNWFLNYQLESYLNRRLSDNIAQMTDGFYSFSFDKLSVGFFNGELSLEDVELIPDSATFHAWQDADSLPQTYYKVAIDRINLKGINLIWRFNYKKLKFSSFEMDAPSVEFFKSYRSKRFRKEESVEKEMKDLFEMVSPYFDAISAKRMDLKNASVSYTVEDPIKPAIYALRNMNFNARGFLLDKNSKSKGQLLYSDNFDFWVEHPQTILDNGQLLISADTIRLNSEDSIIQVKGVSLEPPVEYWKEMHQMSEEFISAKLRTVELRGVDFSHDGIFNHFEARTFVVDSSDIRYFHIKKEDSIQHTHQRKEITVESLSLYKSISPIFSSVAIQNIDLKNARLEYTQQEKEYKDVYTLGHLDIHAGDFLIDSLTDTGKGRRYLYSNTFELKAKDIEANLAKQNHKLEVDDFSLSTLGKYLRIANISLSPINTNTRKDYLQGQIKGISLEGLKYDEGILVSELNIDEADIKYSSLMVPETKTKKRVLSRDQSDVVNLLSPFLKHLTINRINLSNTDLVLDDRASNNIYSLRNTQALVTDFLINKDTREHSPYLFDVGDFDLRFSDFSNYIPGNDYHLEIDKGHFSYQSGSLRLEKIHLIPRQQLKQKKGLYIDFESPLLEVIGGDFDLKNNHLNIRSVELSKPVVSVSKQNLGESHSTKNKTPVTLPSLIHSIDIDEFVMDAVDVSYTNKKIKDDLHINLANLRMNALSLDTNKGVRVKTTVVDSPNMRRTNHLQVEGRLFDIKELVVNNQVIGLHSFEAKDLGIDIKQGDVEINMNTGHFSLSDLAWLNDDNRSFSLGSLAIHKPTIAYHHMPQAKEGESAGKPKDTYRVLDGFSKNIKLGNVNIGKASVDYRSTNLSGVSTEHELNDINFSLEDFDLDTQTKQWDAVDISFSTTGLSFPIMKGFYTIGVGDIDFSKKRNSLIVDKVSMKSAYPKHEFAYKHPTTQDWFNVLVDRVQVSGFDFARYRKENKLYVKNLLVDKTLLENLKNQKVEIEHNKMPLIYEELHKLPIKFGIENAEIRDFSVIYEELPKNVDVAAKLSFMGMNGKLKGLTNIVTSPDQFIELNADGKIMGSGDFSATWIMPVSPDTDKFILSASITNFNLADLNPLVMPMAPAKVESGLLKELTFSTEATSLGATVDMTFLYNDLNVILYKNRKNQSKQKLYTYVANRILSANNPDKKGREPRLGHAEIVRDPYHSTFNYFWQILQPPLIESIGVSKGKQNFMQRAAKTFGDIKNFFRPSKKKKEDKGADESDQ